MARKELKHAAEAKAAADQLLLEIGQVQRAAAGLEREMEEELTRLREQWRARLQPLVARQTDLDQRIKELAKAHKEEFFTGESARLDLKHGALLYELRRRVKRARGVLERLEAEGYLEAIKIAKSVDWERLETWPEERLWLVGTERVAREYFGYEVRE